MAPGSDGGFGSPSLVGLLKALIVMVIFPVLLLTLMQVWKLVFYPLAWLLSAGALWAQLVGWVVVVVGLVSP